MSSAKCRIFGLGRYVLNKKTGERQDGTAAELRFYRCGNAPAAEIQRVYRW